MLFVIIENLHVAASHVYMLTIYVLYYDMKDRVRWKMMILLLLSFSSAKFNLFSSGSQRKLSRPHCMCVLSDFLLTNEIWIHNLEMFLQI